MSKKNEYRFNLRFDETDEDHRKVCQFLSLRMYYVTIYNLLFALRMQVYGGCR